MGVQGHLRGRGAEGPGRGAVRRSDSVAGLLRMNPDLTTYSEVS